MNLFPVLLLSLIGLQGFVGPWQQTYNYFLKTDTVASENKPFTAIPTAINKLFNFPGPTGFQIPNSNTNQTDKFPVFNAKSGKFIQSVPGVASDKSNPLIPCSQTPDKCFLTPTPTTVFKPVVQPPTTPVVTPSPRPICLDQDPPCPTPTPDKNPINPPTPKPTPKSTPGPINIVCTMDAKQCPDGSWVGRVPPACEFAPCPTLDPTVTPGLIPIQNPSIKPDPITPKCPPPVSILGIENDITEVGSNECLDEQN